MAFKMKFPIGKDYLPKVSSGRRSGIKAHKIKFIVLHDVGNDGLSKTTGRMNGTTARGNITYYRNTPTVLASAHAFVDDKEILECIPAVTGTTEKAWHVMYDKPHDNKLYGAESNDAAIGVELCYYPEDKARSLKAYEKYVWYCAYLAYYFKLDPAKCFVGHEVLDPGRKTDPSNGLKWIGKTTVQCMKDIIAEYNACLGKSVSSPAPAPSKPAASAPASNHIGTLIVKVDVLNVRKSANFSAPVVKTIKKGEAYKVFEEKGGLYRVGVDQWCSAGSGYVDYKPVPKSNHIGTIEILADSLNVRSDSSFTAPILKTLSKGSKWKVYKEKNGMYDLGAGHWCSANGKYVKFTKI